MRIKKSVSKNSVSYSVIENVRDINGKSTTKVVEAREFCSKFER